MTYRGLPDPIEKARKPWRSTATRARLYALSQKFARAMSIDLAHGIKTFKKKIDPDALYRAWLSRDYSAVERTIPWQELNDPAFASFGKDYDAMHAGWDHGNLAMPVPKDKRLRWDLENPGIKNFIAGRRAQSFTNLTEDSARNIRGWVTNSFNHALNPRQVADGVRSQIGLLPRHAKAVETYRSGLLAAGHSRSSADHLASGYADRLLDYRAMMIARTETRLASNQGQLIVWRQAADQGLIDRHTARKGWITRSPEPCDICEPMDGVSVPLDSFFTLPDGTTTDAPPSDVHPNCECDVEIIYEGADD